MSCHVDGRKVDDNVNPLFSKFTQRKYAIIIGGSKLNYERVFFDPQKCMFCSIFEGIDLEQKIRWNWKWIKTSLSISSENLLLLQIECPAGGAKVGFEIELSIAAYRCGFKRDRLVLNPLFSAQFSQSSHTTFQKWLFFMSENVFLVNWQNCS